MAGSGKAAKTNLGQRFHSDQERAGSGNPGLDQELLTTGTIRDIRFPGGGKKGLGILVQIDFDVKSVRTSTWVSLKDSFQSILLSYGNREGVLREPPRVMYHYNPVRFDQGYAEIICDNKQERSFDNYTKNRSGNFVAVFSGIKKLGRFPGG